jgi:hypothetical protein
MKHAVARSRTERLTTEEISTPAIEEDGVIAAIVLA